MFDNRCQQFRMYQYTTSSEYVVKRTCAGEESRGEEGDEGEGGEERPVAEVSEDGRQDQQDRESIDQPQTHMHHHHTLDQDTQVTLSVHFICLQLEGNVSVHEGTPVQECF